MAGCFGAVLVGGGLGLMAIYYIDPVNGNDGTGAADNIALPYLTPTAPSPAYGDSILFKEGTEHINGYTVQEISGVGTDINRLIIGTYDAETGDQLTLDDDPTWTRAATLRGKLTATRTDALTCNRDWVTTRYLKLRDATQFPQALFQATQVSGITVQECHLYMPFNSSLPAESTNWAYGIRLNIPSTSSDAEEKWRIIDNCIVCTEGNRMVVCIGGPNEGAYCTDITIRGNTFEVPEGEVPAGFNAKEMFAINVAARGNAILSTQRHRGVSITDNVIRNVPTYNINIHGITPGGSQANEIRRNQCYNAGNGGTDVQILQQIATSYMWITDNIIDYSTPLAGATSGTAVGIFPSRSDGVENHCDHLYIERNYISRAGVGGPTLNTDVGGAGIFVIGGNDLYITGNIVVDCRNGIAITGAFGTTSSSERVHVYNNTVARSVQKNFPCIRGAIDSVFKNNVSVDAGEYGFYVESSGADPVSGYVEDYNISVGSGIFDYAEGDWSSEKPGTITARAPAANDVLADPQFVNPTGTTAADFRPRASSPACGAGTYIAGTRDYDDLPMGYPADIGAFRCPGGDSPAPSFDLGGIFSWLIGLAGLLGIGHMMRDRYVSV